MKDYTLKLQNKENLSQAEIEKIMHGIMSGEASHNDMAEFLLALRGKGATVDEITGAARVMREFVVPIKTEHKAILDTCGTGGDRKGTFNISTIVAFVLAGAGCVVAKHGNRSVSSKCGSADILEALGVNLDIEEENVGKCLDDVGIAFLFAQKLHPAMKNVASVRKELGVETIFNILGPLTNPAQATHQIMGVYNRDLVEPMAEVLKKLGLKRALVVHGADGLDEITTTGKSFISEYNGKDILSYDITPDELQISLANPNDLDGGDMERSLQIFVDVLDGKEGPQHDIVVLNTAYALYISQKTDNIQSGLEMARKSLFEGAARQKLEELKRFTHGG